MEKPTNSKTSTTPSDIKNETATPVSAPKSGKKVKRKSVPEGNIYINATYNNTIVSISEPNGNILCWSSAGACGFKGTRKATPFAAQTAAEKVAEKSKVFGLEKVCIFIKGVGTGREQALRGINSSGLFIKSIVDLTPIPHNGCRAKKSRRV